MTLNQLQYFYQAAKTQHFNQAANNLNISQPSLSRAISSLENELGVILFERMGRNVSLTKAGQVFLEHTEKILENIAVAERKMRQIAASGGEIFIAYVFPLSTQFIPDVAHSFIQIEENRNITFNFAQGLTSDNIEGLKNGKYDIIFGTRDASEMSIRYVPLLRQKMVVIMPKGHELVSCPYIEAKAFNSNLAFEVDAEHLEDAIKGVRAMKIIGGNISMPNKTIVHKYLDEVDPGAELVGACNTFTNRDGYLKGYVTDGIGYMASLKDNNIDVIGKKITIAGSGGAATAVQIQAALDGVAEMSIFARDDKFFANAEETVEKINTKTNCKATLFRLEDLDALKAEIADSVLFTNATGCGMKPLEGYTYIPDKSFFRPDLVVTDVVYAPPETAMLKMAKEVGCKTMNGSGMMLFQGLAAIELIMGEKVDSEYMKAKLGIKYD